MIRRHHFANVLIQHWFEHNHQIVKTQVSHIFSMAANQVKIYIDQNGIALQHGDIKIKKLLNSDGVMFKQFWIQ